MLKNWNKATWESRSEQEVGSSTYLNSQHLQDTKGQWSNFTIARITCESNFIFIYTILGFPIYFLRGVGWGGNWETEWLGWSPIEVSLEVKQEAFLSTLFSEQEALPSSRPLSEKCSCGLELGWGFRIQACHFSWAYARHCAKCFKGDKYK